MEAAKIVVKTEEKRRKGTIHVVRTKRKTQIPAMKETTAAEIAAKKAAIAP